LLAEYYNNILYPVQDRAILAFQETPFYLSGGTALSRGYYNHRYSDDLDYFVNYHADFQRIAEVQVMKLQQIFIDTETDYKGEYFYRVFVGKERLKIEMVNDVPSHIGGLVNHHVLGVIDSKENILANKLTAIVDRTLPKDIVDIYFLLKDGLSLRQSLLDAKSKPKRCINKFNFDPSFPRSLSRNPDVVPVKTGNQNTKNLDARLKTSGMTKECYIRRQLTVNFRANVTIEFKCASILHMRVFISNIFATDG
jgi:hypothetical protein